VRCSSRTWRWPSFLACAPSSPSRRRSRPRSASGIAVIVVQTITVPVNNLIYTHVLREGALAWAGLPDSDLSFPRPVVLHRRDRRDRADPRDAARQVRAQPLQRARRFPAADHGQLRDHGGSLFMVERDYNLAESAVYGWLLAPPGRWRSRCSPVSARSSSTAMCPPVCQGLGITFITIGLMSLGFMSSPACSSKGGLLDAYRNHPGHRDVHRHRAALVAVILLARQRLVSSGDVTMEINGQRTLRFRSAASCCRRWPAESLPLVGLWRWRHLCAVQMRCRGGWGRDAADRGVGLHSARSQGRLASLVPVARSSRT
jgi:Na+-transporting NADH:ubiquinone oxidoreductase subunit E